jgi:hypothetical protein
MNMDGIEAPEAPTEVRRRRVVRDEGEIGPEPLPGLPPFFLVRAGMALRAGVGFVLRNVVPEVALYDMASGVGYTMLLGVVADLGVAELLEEEPMIAHRIAHRTKTDADAIHRVLRALASRGVFKLRKDGRFENNRVSRQLLRSKPSRLRDFCEYFASAANVRAWSVLGDVVKTGKGGYELGNGESIWSWFDRHPHERETFAHAMMGMTFAEAPLIAKLYPWDTVGVLCDVGGGRGALLSELLVRNPKLRGVLCDAPGVLESARPLLARRGVQDRVTLEPGSFFDRVPQGADAYLLKNVLHDWDDERAAKILTVCRAAMSPGTRLLVIEAVVPRNGTDGIGPLVDAQMLVVSDGGRERAEHEMKDLLRGAGFRAQRVLRSPTVALFEATAI